MCNVVRHVDCCRERNSDDDAQVRGEEDARTCIFFTKGRCKRGEDCDFLQEALPKDTYKTALCGKFKSGGTCPYDAQCMYAHGERDLRRHAAASTAPRSVGRTTESSASYKTVLCKNFAYNGQCPYGRRCTFAHGKVELPHGEECT